MLLLGMAAWVLRYVCFAFGYTDPGSWILYAGIILHGVCYDFFFVTGYMYTEKKAGEKDQECGAGSFYFCHLWAGHVISAPGSPVCCCQVPAGSGHNWQSVWLVPASHCGGCIVVFYSFFQGKKENQLK